jgi:hypothetical protein
MVAWRHRTAGASRATSRAAMESLAGRRHGRRRRLIPDAVRSLPGFCGIDSSHVMTVDERGIQLRGVAAGALRLGRIRERIVTSSVACGGIAAFGVALQPQVDGST